MPIKSQRNTGRYFILLLAAGVVIWSVYQEFKPHQEVGQMEYRLLTGINDNTFEVIMLETSKQFTVFDTSLKEIFEYNDAEVISRPEQLQLLQTYNDLQYRVSLHNIVSEEKAEYRLSRENFNNLRFNSNIRFEIDRKVKDSITSIVGIQVD